MHMVTWWRVALAPALVVVFSASVSAQIYEEVGTRAQGMAGAFVAVADDATAAWWNPAGLAAGAYFNAIVERGRVTQPRDPSDLAPARRATITGFAAAFPALGVSYYRTRLSEIPAISRISASPASTGSGAQTRQDLGGAGAAVRSLGLSQFGLTVGQSLNDHLVVGSTLKLIRGGVGTGVPADGRGLLDVGDDVPLAQNFRADLDAGVMAVFEGLRFGLSVRHLSEPTFGRDADAITLKRQARTGVAVMTGRHGMLDGVTVAADADLTKTPTVFGDVRHVAFGGEAWMLNRRLGVRGGLNRNTIDGGATTISGGLSLALSSGMYLDAARAFGSDRSLQGWSGSVRLTY